MAALVAQQEKPLVAIYGPTASGKTALAIRLAKQFNGEVISADSRAIYKGLDIGTAKPSLVEREGVVLWGFDLLAPGDLFTVADFKRYAVEKIVDIRRRGKLPILVGGTGLYMDSVVLDYQFPPREAEDVRAKYEAMSLEALHEYCIKNGVALPENKQNKRYVINTILRIATSSSRRSQPIDHCIVVGISTEKAVLRARLEARAKTIVGPKVREEAEEIGKKYGWDNEAMTANVYPLMKKYLDKEIDLERLRSAFLTLEWRLAKRQLTWLRRNTFIRWCTLEEAYTYCARALVNLNNS